MPYEEASEPAVAIPVASRRWLGWSSFGFALLQSLCLALVAVSGLRTLMGLSSLLVAGGLYPPLEKFHSDWIRVPMMVFASVGSLVNLLVLWQIRRLRNRPSSAWRQAPVTARKKHIENLQGLLSIVTLALVAVEFLLHRAIH